MRLSATRSLFERRDVIIVTSVSCIYGLGSPEAYYGMLLPLERGQRISREQGAAETRRDSMYERNDHDFSRGTFRVRGDIIEVYPSCEELGLRIELFGDDVDELATFDPLTGKTLRRHDRCGLSKSHFVAPRERTKRAVGDHQGGTGRAPRRTRTSGQTARSAAAASSGRCSISR